MRVAFQNSRLSTPFDYINRQKIDFLLKMPNLQHHINARKFNNWKL